MNTAASAAILLPKAAVWARGAVRRDRANAYALLEPWTLPPLGGDLPRLGLMPPAPYEDARIRVDVSEAAVTVTVLEFRLSGEECDGNTCSPDTWGAIRAYVGALFHDRWYLSMEAIAKAWGWPLARVRKLGDIIYATILRDLVEMWARDVRSRPCGRLRRAWREIEIASARTDVRLYYSGVRAFGGVAHRIMSPRDGGGRSGGSSSCTPTPAAPALAAAVLLALSAAGCAGGCAAPPSAWAWDDDVGLYATVPAHSFTNTVTGAHWERNHEAHETHESAEDAE